MNPSFPQCNTTGWDGISYSMPNNTPKSMIARITVLFNLILKYNLIPENLNISKIKSITKDHGMTNCFAQILEKLILQRNPSLNDVSTNQFGFQNGLSTIQPFFILFMQPLKEVSIWCRTKQVPCYITSLDLKKN